MNNIYIYHKQCLLRLTQLISYIIINISRPSIKPLSAGKVIPQLESKWPLCRAAKASALRALIKVETKVKWHKNAIVLKSAARAVSENGG